MKVGNCIWDVLSILCLQDKLIYYLPLLSSLHTATFKIKTAWSAFCVKRMTVSELPLLRVVWLHAVFVATIPPRLANQLQVTLYCSSPTPRLLFWRGLIFVVGGSAVCVWGGNLASSRFWGTVWDVMFYFQVIPAYLLDLHQLNPFVLPDFHQRNLFTFINVPLLLLALFQAKLIQETLWNVILEWKLGWGKWKPVIMQ